MKDVYEKASKGQQNKSQIYHLLGHCSTSKVRFPYENSSRVVTKGDYKSLGDLQRQSILLSAMHFMDPYNFDLERVQRCLIHYAVPDGRIIPFCTMNSIHRAEVEKKLGVPIKEWKAQHKVEISQPF